jgi:hypothetical protein
MLDAIRFLEHVGRETMTADDYSTAVAALDLDQPQRQALMDHDARALIDLLQARPTMFFGVFAPEEAPAEDEPFEDQPDEPVDPDQI